VDNTGEVVNHLIYDSYGNVVSESNAAVDTRYLFTGREWDEEIELYYYRARYYDPEIGRFIVEDPIGFSGGDANLYRYVHNSPINRIDPSGTRDMRWPVNGSVTNNSSRPVVILNSTRVNDFLETLQPGQRTPDVFGRSKDADGVWVCKQNQWVFYEVVLKISGSLKVDHVNVPITFPGGSVPIPILVPGLGLAGDVIVTENAVRDRALGNLAPGNPGNRGRTSSRTPPGGSFNCSCLNVVDTFPDASVWRPVLPGDEERENLFERS